MPDKVIYVYSLDQSEPGPERQSRENLHFRSWRPGITRFIPPNSPFSFFSLWIMHYLNIFRNREYSAYSIVDNGKEICSLVCVPSLYRWSFMNRNDLQIKNVFTHENYRGRGYASWLMQYTIFETADKDRVYWYMTDENNIPSQKLCKKIGFKYEGIYRRKRNRFFLYEGEIFKDT